MKRKFRACRKKAHPGLRFGKYWFYSNSSEAGYLIYKRLTAPPL